MWLSYGECKSCDLLYQELENLEPRWGYCPGQRYLILLLSFLFVPFSFIFLNILIVIKIHITKTVLCQPIVSVQFSSVQNILIVVQPVSRTLIILQTWNSVHISYLLRLTFNIWVSREVPIKYRMLNKFCDLLQIIASLWQRSLHNSGEL